MKKQTTDHNGTGAKQHSKPMTPISIYRQRRRPMNNRNRRMIISVAAVVLAGPVLAGPRPETAHYAFSTIDFPGAASTDLLGFTTRTMVGDFADAGGNMHGWLLSAHGGEFRQFDVPGAWFTTLSAINNSGDFGGIYRDDLEHPARRHGFIVVKDVLTTIDYPGSTRTSIVQMNDRGQVVGIGRIPSEGATTPYGF